MTDYYLRADLASDPAVKDQTPGALVRWASTVAEEASPADVYRNKEGRKTLRFERSDNPYFLKLHLGIGWGEIFKNLFKLRLPVLGASNEYHAVNELQRLGVDTMSVAAYASEGFNPAAIRSLIVTDELVGTVSLEDYCMHWGESPPDPRVKMRLIAKVADSARRMHRAGINHRDFYLCHFHLDEETLQQAEIRCHLIDLHRAQLRSKVPVRWQIKDLAGLFFSAMDCGLSQRDLLRFVSHYNEGGLRNAFGRDAHLWRSVQSRATKLYIRERGVEPPALRSPITVR
ncbi:MAG: lipopolysaccharide core heptose(I) kinase RfaP [Halioglobus sp.]